jgi:hypothetical protein
LPHPNILPIFSSPYASVNSRKAWPYFLAVDALAAAGTGRPVCLLLAAPAGYRADLFLQHQIHQVQTGLPNPFTPLRNQPIICAGGNTTCYRRISIDGHFREMFHCSP